MERTNMKASTKTRAFFTFLPPFNLDRFIRSSGLHAYNINSLSIESHHGIYDLPIVFMVFVHSALLMLPVIYAYAIIILERVIVCI
jgi:hypothetical protein